MYITVKTLIQSFQPSVLIQLSNDDHQAEAPNVAILQQAIAYASERIDAALRSRYRLPLTSVPTVIEHYCLNLARYWLYTRRPESPLPDTLKAIYAQTLKELEQIATGKLHLGISEQTHTKTEKEAEPAARAEMNTVEKASLGDLLPDSSEYRTKPVNRIATEGY